MIIIGVILANAKIKMFLRDWSLYYGLVLKLIVIPIIVFLLSLLVNGPDKVINTIIIMSAMPASAMTSILAEHYKKENNYAAVYVSATTLFSLVTTTVLIKLIL